MHNFREAMAGCVFLFVTYIWLSSIFPFTSPSAFYHCQKSPTNPLVKILLFLAAKLSLFSGFSVTVYPKI